MLEKSDGKIKWKLSTFPFMMNIISKSLMDIKLHVENHCQNKGKHDIEINDVFNSKPEMRKLYANAISFAFE